jgi:TolB-like protein
MNSAILTGAQETNPPASRNGLFHLLTELRRRRVCRAVTMYSLVMWLVCQIVDVISPALELPDWTLKLVIVFGLLGLPIIIILSWLFEITPDGLVVESLEETSRGWSKTSQPKHIADRLIDGSLILAALAIGVQLAVGTLGGEVATAESPSYRIAVMPFGATSDKEAASLSEGLAIELQHALRQRYGVTVIASSNPAQLKGSMSLTGAVSANESVVRVAVTMIDFETGEVVWSAAFQQPRDPDDTSTSELAQQIVAALPLPREETEPVRLANVPRH